MAQQIDSQQIPEQQKLPPLGELQQFWVLLQHPFPHSTPLEQLLPLLPHDAKKAAPTAAPAAPIIRSTESRRDIVALVGIANFRDKLSKKPSI